MPSSLTPDEADPTNAFDEGVIEVKPYAPEFRDTIRSLCADTGFLGQPIDPIFQDRELFADFLTSYYTDAEPESSFVLTKAGHVRGYLLGSRHHHRVVWHWIRKGPQLFFKFLAHAPHYRAPTWRYLKWLLLRGGRETPSAPKETAHFHINLLPDVRTIAGTRLLVDTFLHYLNAHGETSVYGQMVTFDKRRGERLFERYGFRVINRSEVTKYRALHPEPVYLCTVVKDLTERAQLYSNRPDGRGSKLEAEDSVARLR